MADYARVLAALDAATGTTTLAAFQYNATRAILDAVEGDIVASTVRSRFAEQDDPWVGTASELLRVLTPEPPPKGWPSTPQHLSGSLRRSAPALRAVGIGVDFDDRTSNRRTIRIEKMSPESMSSASPSSRHDADDSDDSDDSGKPTFSPATPGGDPEELIQKLFPGSTLIAPHEADLHQELLTIARWNHSTDWEEWSDRSRQADLMDGADEGEPDG